MQEDTQFQAQGERRPGTNPLLIVVAVVVALGAGGWYFLYQQPAANNAPPVETTVSDAAAPAAPASPEAPTAPASPAVPAPGEATPAAPAQVADVPPSRIARTTNALIPITPTATAQRQAVASAGKDDPFRTVSQAPKTIAVTPIKKPVIPASAPAIPKEYFAKSILVLGIIDTPKGGYAIVSYEGRNEIARVGDAIKTAIVKSVSAQSRTVTFREDGQEITRALEVS